MREMPGGWGELSGGRSYCILWSDGTVLWPLTCNWINECVEHCAEGPTVKDAVGHFIFCKGVAMWVCAHVFLPVMCTCTSLLITVFSHHDDGEAGVNKYCSLLLLVHCSGSAIIFGLCDWTCVCEVSFLLTAEYKVRKQIPHRCYILHYCHLFPVCVPYLVFILYYSLEKSI